MTNLHSHLAPPARPPAPQQSPLTNSDVLWFTLVNLVLISAMWVRHGGLDHLGDASSRLIAIGQICGLYGAFAIDPFQPEHLRAAIPDLDQRDVFVCGPASLLATSGGGLRKAGVPTTQICACMPPSSRHGVEAQA